MTRMPARAGSRIASAARASAFIVRASRGRAQHGVNDRGSTAQRSLKTWLEVLEAEAIPHAGLGLEMLRRLRVVFDLAPQPRDVHVEVVRLVAVIGPPHVLQQHPVGED